MDAILVITTVGDEEQGNLIARELIARRLAACVNMIPGIRSFYRWQGRICRDTEYLLIIKTLREEFPAITETIQELHTYDLPEILSFSIGDGEPQFLAWIATSLDKEAVYEEEDADFPDLERI